MTARSCSSLYKSGRFVVWALAGFSFLMVCNSKPSLPSVVATPTAVFTPAAEAFGISGLIDEVIEPDELGEFCSSGKKGDVYFVERAGSPKVFQTSEGVRVKLRYIGNDVFVYEQGGIVAPVQLKMGSVLPLPLCSASPSSFVRRMDSYQMYNEPVTLAIQGNVREIGMG
ncbi:hypothetical protein HYU12_03515 [Candidatus Woesearchaeota archaeon]|nr:hypothetical protein [Candidatus Woesearchaeota archaeon]